MIEKEIQFSPNPQEASLVVGVTTEGNIVVEFWNYGKAIYDAYETHIDKRDKQAVIAAMCPDAKQGANPDETIMQFFANEFTEHRDIRRWLMQHHIPFRQFHASGNYPAVPDLPTLDDAIALAKQAHAQQTDKAGAPYYGHLERVMNGMTTPDEKIVAVLHDSLEDTYVTPQYLERCGYPPHIITAIEALTKLPAEEDSDEGYFRFIERAAQNPLARTVKIADLSDNMNLSRIPSPSDRDYARREKYQRALEYLGDEN